MKGGASNPMGMLAGLAGGKSQPRQPDGGNRPPPALLGSLPLRIDREGRWHYQGSPINRLPLVKLFAAVLQREEDGAYWLATPAHPGKRDVEDVPFMAGGRPPRGNRAGQPPGFPTQ